MSVPALRTARLRLDPLCAADLPDYQRLFADPAMTWFWMRPPDTPQKVASMVESRLAAVLPDGLGFWTVRADGAMIGAAHLRPSHELPGGPAEIGWYVAVEQQGRGYGTEIVSAVLGHGFDTVGLSEVWALVREDNTPSLALAKRVGFVDVGAGEHYGGPHRRLRRA